MGTTVQLAASGSRLARQIVLTATLEVCQANDLRSSIDRLPGGLDSTPAIARKVHAVPFTPLLADRTFHAPLHVNVPLSHLRRVLPYGNCAQG